MSIVICIIIGVSITLNVYLYIDRRIELKKIRDKITGLSFKIENDSKMIYELQKMLAYESKQKVLYRDRSLELEDAINEGAGVTLRNEITRVECIFDSLELATMLDGVKYLIREYWQSTSGIKYYLTIIEKLEKHIVLMNKEKDAKDQVKP